MSPFASFNLKQFRLVMIVCIAIRFMHVTTNVYKIDNTAIITQWNLFLFTTTGNNKQLIQVAQGGLP